MYAKNILYSEMLWYVAAYNVINLKIKIVEIVLYLSLSPHKFSMN